MEWGDYRPFDPGVSQPLDEVPRRDARAAFTRLMAAKDDRIVALKHLLGCNGIELVGTDEGLQQVNDWFRVEVRGDPNISRLDPEWYAVVNDLALFLGDVMIERAPNLYWTMFDKGRKNVSYQRHVIMGFTKVPNPKYNVDVDRLLATYGHRVIAGHLDIETDAFATWVNSVHTKAA